MHGGRTRLRIHLVTKQEALDGRLNDHESWVVYCAYENWERTEAARKEWEAKRDQRQREDSLESTKFTEKLDGWKPVPPDG